MLDEDDFAAIQDRIHSLSISDQIKKTLSRDITELQESSDRQFQRISRHANDLEQELRQAQREIIDRETHTEERFEKFVEESRRREQSLQNAYQEILTRYQVLEKSSFDRQKELEEEFVERQKVLEEEFIRRSKGLQNKEAELRERIHEYETERELLREESQKNIQNTSTTFVEDTVSSLETRGEKLSRISFWWSVSGGTSLLLGGVILAVLTISAALEITNDITWKVLVFYLMKGTVFIGAALILARYAFIFSSNYMKESLRTYDRVHALKFGQFFVTTYGASASWEEVQGAFANWNSSGNAEWNSSPRDLTLEGMNPSAMASATKASE